MTALEGKTLLDHGKAIARRYAGRVGADVAEELRAEAVLRALRVYGVNASQMEAVSWGENRPKAPDHDEAAWAQNRRADLQYPTK